MRTTRFGDIRSWCERAGTRARGGFLLIEAFTSIVLLGMLVGAWMMLQSSAGALNEVHLARQRCILAAQAQLESLTATGAAIAEAEVERCWPGVRTEIRRQAGEGGWQGLTLATVSASLQVRGRTVRVEFSRYVPPEGEAP
jgi:hypothetical protein